MSGQQMESCEGGKLLAAEETLGQTEETAHRMGGNFYHISGRGLVCRLCKKLKTLNTQKISDPIKTGGYRTKRNIPK